LVLWRPAVALVGSYELLMTIIRFVQVTPGVTGVPGAPADACDDHPLQARATEELADEVAAGQVPSVRAIRSRLHVGQSWAQRARAHLTGILAA
jgi:hypothetical protein